MAEAEVQTSHEDFNFVTTVIIFNKAKHFKNTLSYALKCDKQQLHPKISCGPC